MKYLENSVKANDLYANVLRRKLESGEFKRAEREARTREILRHYNQALHLYSDHDLVWFNLASFYANILKNNEEAIRCYQNAIRINPRPAKYYQNLGVAFRMDNNLVQAEENWKKCIETDSNNAQARFFLTRLYIETNKIDQARSINDELFALDSLSDMPYENLGLILLNEGDTSLAMKYWEKAAKLNSGNINILRSLSAWFRENNDPQKAQLYQNLFRGAQEKAKKTSE
jgi:tetratricopeptide (TPR) repeat protein